MKSSFKNLLPFVLAGMLVSFDGCKNDDPTPENIPEYITKVVLTFSPSGSGNSIIVTAIDPDGGGVQDIEVNGPINLIRNKQYTLSLELINELYLPGDEEYNITNAVQQEGEEHQFFFGFSEGVFSSPPGVGNIKENAATAVGNINYLDEDLGGLPIGITTSWTTQNMAASSKSFRVILKHQPEIKSTTSSSLDGESDIDITFELNVN